MAGTAPVLLKLQRAGQQLVRPRQQHAASSEPPAAKIAAHRCPPMQNRPAQCTAPRGEWLLVPFLSVLEYYWCE